MFSSSTMYCNTSQQQRKPLPAFCTDWASAEPRTFPTRRLPPFWSQQHLRSLWCSEEMWELIARIWWHPLRDAQKTPSSKPQRDRSSLQPVLVLRSGPPFLEESYSCPNHEEREATLTAYRSISLTSILCKLLERVIATKLRWFMESKNMLNQYQADFRKGRGCVDHIVRLTQDIAASSTKKQMTLESSWTWKKPSTCFGKSGSSSNSPRWVSRANHWNGSTTSSRIEVFKWGSIQLSPYQ